MDPVFIGGILLNWVSGTSAAIAVGQYVYGVFRSNKDLQEVRRKSEIGDEEIYDDKGKKRRLHKVYVSLAKAEPYARRVITIIQIRTGVLLLIAVLVMYGLIKGVNFAGSVIHDNAVATILILALFIYIVNSVLPRLLPGVKSKTKQNLDKLLDPMTRGPELNRLAASAASRANNILTFVGFAAISKYEKELMKSYVETLAIIRIIEAEALTEELDMHAKLLYELSPDITSKQTP